MSVAINADLKAAFVLARRLRRSSLAMRPRPVWLAFFAAVAAYQSTILTRCRPSHTRRRELHVATEQLYSPTPPLTPDRVGDWAVAPVRSTWNGVTLSPLVVSDDPSVELPRQRNILVPFLESATPSPYPRRRRGDDARGAAASRPDSEPQTRKTLC